MNRSPWKKASSSVYKKILVVFIALVMIGIAVSVSIDLFLRPIFIAEAEFKVTRLVTDAISQAVYEHAKLLNYTEMIHYQTNHQGDIILMQPDLQKVNEFTSQVNLTIQDKLNTISEQRISIPIAHALGLQLLAGLGPRVYVKMIPIGLVKPPQIIDSFESAGINQTRHKIYMNVKAEVQLVVPFVQKSVQLETQVPVTEVTIMGKVPDIYVGVEGGLLGDLVKNKSE